MRLAASILFPLIALSAIALEIDSEGRILYLDYFNEEDVLALNELKSKTELVFCNAMADDVLWLKKFTELKTLRVEGGIVVYIYITPGLKQVFVENSQLRNVKIDDKYEYQLNNMEVTHCQLRHVPSYLYRLKLLECLDLSFNNINNVEMAVFSNLKNLKVLKLNNNGLLTLSTSAVLNLPRLNTLWLNSNSLGDVDGCRWNMLTLESLKFDNNNLRYVTLPEFPNLKEVAAHKNAFQCSWLEQFLSKLAAAKVKLSSPILPNACDDSKYMTTAMECPVENSELAVLLRRQHQELVDLNNKIMNLEQAMKTQSASIQWIVSAVADTKILNKTIIETK